MKKLVVAAALTLSYGTAFAGMYHSGPTNICADCHTMHASMAHDFNGATPVSATAKSFTDGSWLPNSGAPEARLLKGTETGVCIACHDGQTWAPDVVGTHTNGYVRSAGFIPPLTAPAADQAKGHTMDFAGTAPGGISFTDFTCASCHSPHGKADSFRNLNPYALYGKVNDGTGYPKFYLSATPVLASNLDARIAVASYQAMTVNTGYYQNKNVYYENGGASKLDKYCGKCHGAFHDETLGTNQANSANQAIWVDGTGHFKRHPTNNEIGRPAGPSGSPSYTTKVFAANGSTPGYVGCLSCHKAHGTANPFNLFYAKAAVTSAANTLDDDESGTGPVYGGLCSNCHGQAR